MKLLFDENLSHFLVTSLTDVFPGTTSHIETTLRTQVIRIIAFHRDPVASFLVLP